jgi:DNA-binding response OmpR family regulator
MSNKLRILVVEGKTHLVQQLQQACVGTEFEVLSCWDRASALELLQHGNIDLISAEAFMESGLVMEVIRDVREMAHHRGTPIMIVAAEPGPTAEGLLATTAIASELLGADKFITMREFDGEWLLAETRALLLSRRALRPPESASS